MPSVRALLSATASVALGLALTASAAPSSTQAAHLVDPEAARTGVATVVPGTSYAFTSTIAGKPVRWNPCETIHWRSNVSRGPAGGLAVLQAAVSTIAAATGTHWIYDGATNAVPAASLLKTNTTATQPVVLGWTDSGSSDLLKGYNAYTAGMTRTLWFSSTSASRTVAATRAAVVALNRSSRLPLRGTVSWQSVATHELGHVMGLAHARTSGELMAPVLSYSVSGLQAGDRAGLARVGAQAGCVAFPG